MPAATASPRADSGSVRSASTAAAASSQCWPSTAAASASCRAAGLSVAMRASITGASDRGTRSAPPLTSAPPAPSSTARQYNGLPPASSSRRPTARGNSPVPSARPSATVSSGPRPPRRTRPARWSPARNRSQPSPSRVSSPGRADTTTSTRSACRRRSANSSARADGPSAHCRSSISTSAICWPRQHWLSHITRSAPTASGSTPSLSSAASSPGRPPAPRALATS